MALFPGRVQINEQDLVDQQRERVQLRRPRRSGVFDRPRYEAWTGVVFGPMQSLEWLYLWLACTADTSLCSLSVDPAAIDAGLVEPMFRASTMAVPSDHELAYLTWRLAGHTKSGDRIEVVPENRTPGFHATRARP